MAYQIPEGFMNFLLHAADFAQNQRVGAKSAKSKKLEKILKIWYSENVEVLYTKGEKR